MSFQIELDKYERAYGRFVHKIQTAIQQTFEEQEESEGLTQGDLARELDVDKSTISRRLNGSGNITIRSISDVFTAMGREPLSNFWADGLHCSFVVGGPPTQTSINIYMLIQGTSNIHNARHNVQQGGAIPMGNVLHNLISRSPTALSNFFLTNPSDHSSETPCYDLGI